MYLIGSKKNCSDFGSGELERTPRCSEVSVPGVLAQWVSIYSMDRVLMAWFKEIDTVVWDHSLFRVTPNWKEQFCELMRTKPSIQRMRRKGPKQRQLGRMASSDRDDDSGVSYADRQDSERDLEPPPLMLFPSPLNVPIFCHLNTSKSSQDLSDTNEVLNFRCTRSLDYNSWKAMSTWNWKRWFGAIFTRPTWPRENAKWHHVDTRMGTASGTQI